MTDGRLELIRGRLENTEGSSMCVVDIKFLLNLVDVLQAKLDTLLPAAQQTSSLLEVIRKDTPWVVSPGVRELYQAVDQDLTAALEAVLNG